MSKILLTGIAGFIGCHTAKALAERGDEVVGVDDFNDYYNPKLKEDRVRALLGSNNIKIYRGNVADKELLKKVFLEHKLDKICHLAAQAGVRYSLEKPEIYINSNIVGFQNILDLAREFGASQLVFASSSSVYGGNKKIPFTETDAVDRPISLYAATKKANELQAHTYHHLFGLNAIGLRFFTVYGPWGRPDMAYFKFAQNILNNRSIEVYNHGQMKRDFTYIDDIVLGIIKALNHCQGYEIYNLGNNQPVELEKFIQVLEEKLDKKAIKQYLPLQPGDVEATYADINKAKEKLDWQPKTSIEEGLEKFVEWYRDYYSI